MDQNTVWQFILLLLSNPSILVLLFIYAAYDIVHDYVKDNMSSFCRELIIKLKSTAEKLKQSARVRTDPQGRVHISHHYYAGVTLSLVCKACNSMLFKIIMLKIGTIFYIFNHPSVTTAGARLYSALKAKSPILIFSTFVKDYLKSVAVEAGKHLYVSATGILPPIVEFASFILVNVFSLCRKVKKEAQKERSSFLNWWEDFLSKMNINGNSQLLLNTTSSPPTLASVHDHNTSVSAKNISRDYLFRVRVTTDRPQADPVNTPSVFHATKKDTCLDEDDETASESNSEHSDIDIVHLRSLPPIIISR